MKTYIPLLLTVITFASVAVAQSTKDKIEIGVQSTSLTIVQPDFPSFGDAQTGIGGRVTYNFNQSIAAEAEINFFPQKQLILNADGSAIQGQFGVKLGKRFEKFGIFGKVRPGFLSVDRVIPFIPFPGTQVGPIPDFTIRRRTFFTTDIGGVLELYPSRRSVVRFEAGDTAIRHPPRFGQLRSAKFTHNFQFTAGVAFRLGDFPDEGTNVTTPGGAQERTKRFEVGAQFTSLLVRPSNTFGALFQRKHAEPGFGGRFTFNLTESIAFEAEGNYYTREQFTFIQQGGHIFQGQFGGKVGKRFDRWGVFGKARPGFVGFTRIREFPSGVPIPGPPSFRFVNKFYPSLDIGGVVEFYISPRWMARFDVGDTLIRYDEIVFPGATPPFIIQPRETTHNLQVSSGIGFRF
jgi:hypothetical protein